MDAYPARPTRRRGRRLLDGALAAVAALALAFAGVVSTPVLQGAQAASGVSTAMLGPAAITTTDITATGAFSGVVPSGVCTVTALVVGAAGGSAVSTTTNANGAGAEVTATYPVVPGMTYSGTVGGGGGKPTGSGSTDTAGPGGVNGGGMGGTSDEISGIKHHGAGGGGYTDLSFGGTLAILAGGGGGAGGGHSTTTNGAGGNAGLPTGSGVASGSTGNVGRDYPNATTVGGGVGGGGLGSPGAGGVNSQSSAADGFPGVLRVGGKGGNDTNPDAGGGGGGGYTGGGGGASTLTYNTEFAGAAGSEIAGAGGGGGSSYVAPSTTYGSVSGISSALGDKITTAMAGNGANGSVKLTWNGCDYDLGVDKSVSAASVAQGSTVTWTVAITNNGPAAMTQGDTVTLTDTLPGAGAKTITSISTSGGSNTVLTRDPVTCSPAVGASMASSITCSRPYETISGGITGGVRGLDVGETLTIVYTQPATDAAGTVLTNTATVTDRSTNTANNTDSATTTVIVPPDAVDDQSLGNALRTPVSITVTSNDTGTLQPNSVVLYDTTAGTTITSPYVVAGQGTWTVAGNVITFTPLSTFLGDPTPVRYRVSNTAGLTDTAQVTITYVPVAVDDSAGPFAMGTPATVAPLTNDDGTFTVSTLRLVDPATSASATSVTVAGEGTWTIAGADVIFTPLASFTADPAPIGYRITDSTGDTVSATIAVDYTPGAVDDASLGNTIGATVDQSVLTNDNGTFTTGSLVFMPGAVSSLSTADGDWSIPSAGVIRFTPAPGFMGDPAPVTYRVTDVDGDTTTATVTVGYVPAATDDASNGNALGTDVTVKVLTNDTGGFGPNAIRLMDGASPVLQLTVPGEGVWEVTGVSGNAVVFLPESGFYGDPTPVSYRATDLTGDTVTATVTITYLPEASDDSDLGNTIGSTVNVAVLGNDLGDFTLGSVRVIDPATTLPVVSLVVAGEGTWRANTDGTITFTPESGFLGDPTPVGYQVTDSTGDTVSAQLTVAYVPAAAADQKDGNVLHAVVSVDPLANDTGDFDVASLRLLDGTTPVTTLTVAGEGTWTVNTTTGIVTFTPLSTFVSNPAAVGYQVTDTTGDTVDSTITVTYLPAATNDSSLGNKRGTAVSISILGNDSGALDVSSARLLSGPTPMMNMVVAGEGSWHMNASTGVVTFTPEPGFTGDPAPVPYRVLDINGNVATANVTITYLHATALELALTGMSAQTPLMIAFAAIILGLGALMVSRMRRLTARHRA